MFIWNKIHILMYTKLSCYYYYHISFILSITSGPSSRPPAAIVTIMYGGFVLSMPRLFNFTERTYIFVYNIIELLKHACTNSLLSIHLTIIQRLSLPINYGPFSNMVHAFRFKSVAEVFQIVTYDLKISLEINIRFSL